MKKILSFMLVIAFVFSTMTPMAHAASLTPDSTVDSFEQRDGAGNKLEFELVEGPNGEYTLYYYENNVLTKTYGMSSGNSTITVTDETEATNQQYTLHSNPATVVEGPTTWAKDRWYHAGYFNYGYSETFECNPTAVVSWKDTDSYSGTYYVDVYQNSVYSDWVAVVTSTLISFGLAAFAPATLAAAILSTMIGNCGAQIINDIISIPFIEEYECSSVTYTMRAEVIGPGMDTDVVDYEGGVEYWVKYADAPDEHYQTGWTPTTWNCRAFAVEVWEDSVPFWPPFPGIL